MWGRVLQNHFLRLLMALMLILFMLLLTAIIFLDVKEKLSLILPIVRVRRMFKMNYSTLV